jgi:glycosyltransferase involved in cell wall biosynthesis
MTRIFCIGTGPLLSGEARTFSGQCLRTLHFVEPLRAAGHEIELIVHPVPGALDPAATEAIAEEREHHGLPYAQLLINDEARFLPYLQERMEGFRPDAILGINPYPAHLTCLLDTAAPIWCDLNGYAMAEGQTRAYLDDDDACLAHFHRHELGVVRRADRFSTVSTPQKHALLGELAVVGRLGRFTFDYDFATVVPNAVADHYRDLGAGERASLELGDAPALFRVLWCGGFNTWTDVELLFYALQSAMEHLPELRFVATGGSVIGHDEKTYERFARLVQASPVAERCELRGWIAATEVDSLLMQCDLGINIDSKNNETVFGARNRITTMLGCGLPVLTTLGAEISWDLQQRGLGLFVELGDAKGLVEKLVYAVGHRKELRELGRRGREFAIEEYAPAKTIRACLEWMSNPRPAPDNAERLRQRDDDRPLSQRPLNAIEAELAELTDAPLDDLLRDRAELQRIRGGRLFKTAKAIKSILRGERK